MNIGWIFLICALILLAILAFQPRRRQERGITMESQNFAGSRNFSARLDEYDARLVRRDEIANLLRGGQKIKAIKIYREDTGASLADAKAAVERMEMTGSFGVASMVQEAQEEPSTEANAPEAVNDMSDLTGEVEALVMKGKKIQAIKLYRERTGLGLREAKEAIDLLESSLLLHGASSLRLPDTEGRMPVMEPPGEDVRSLLLEGKKIQAVKLYHEQTGASLKDAKAAIDLLEQSLHYGLEQA